MEDEIRKLPEVQQNNPLQKWTPLLEDDAASQ